MARSPKEHAPVLSVLDRLLDDDPDSQRDDPKADHRVLREMENSVRRDLQDLLNTRWRCVSWPPNLDELDLSLVNYGIPDFTGTSMNGPREREELRLVVERIIRKFEPRLKTVHVKLMENADSLDRTLRFRIDAELHAEPKPVPVVFDSRLEPTTGDFRVKTEGR